MNIYNQKEIIQQLEEIRKTPRKMHASYLEKQGLLEIINQQVPNNFKIKEKIDIILKGTYDKCSCGELSKADSKWCSLTCRNKDPKIRKNIGEKNSENKVSRMEKTKKTNLEKYEVEFPLQYKKFQDKRKETCIEKFGEDHHAKNRIVKEKTKQTCIERYGVEYSSQQHIGKDIIEKLESYQFLYEEHITNKKSLEQIAKELNVSASCVILYIKRHNIEIKRYSVSQGHKEISEFLQQYTIVRDNDRNIISPFELDIFLPEYNFAIEYNGIYWHSSDTHNKENKERHKKKLELCRQNGIDLMFIREDQYQNNKELIFSMLRNKIKKNYNKIFARNCQIKEINSNEARIFLENTHIQGYVNSSIRLGLYYNDELVSLITFGKPRFNKKYSWELLRFSSKLNTNVVGGFSKLLKYFRKYYFGSIISYADCGRSNGNLYTKNGFTLINQTDPGFYWTKSGKVYHRTVFQKYKLEKILSKFDPLLNEYDNMFNNDYRIMYDCGQWVFVLE